jgi:DNA-binding CsgD family transcriptional regulator
MAVMIAALAVTVAAVAAEGAPATARLAGRLACWAARRRYAGDPGRAARRAEEWQALACRRPGGRVLGLLTAARFAVAAVRAARMLGHFTATPAPPPVFPQLTGRERQVLDLLAQGRANTAIAARLSLSHKTVRNHVSTILAKLQVTDRAQAIIAARDAGLGHQSRI